MTSLKSVTTICENRSILLKRDIADHSEEVRASQIIYKSVQNQLYFKSSSEVLRCFANIDILYERGDNVLLTLVKMIKIDLKLYKKALLSAIQVYYECRRHCWTHQQQY